MPPKGRAVHTSFGERETHRSGWLFMFFSVSIPRPQLHRKILCKVEKLSKVLSFLLFFFFATSCAFVK
jgi:hypothetical protein